MKDYAFLFPGQGSQVIGMGKDLYEKTDLGKKIFKTADEVLGYKLSEICFNGPEEELKLTHNTQPALLTVSYILFSLLGKTPQIAAGHSLGEYSAVLASGGLKFEDAVMLVHKRGKYMQEAVPVGKGAMAAIIGTKISEIEEKIKTVSGVVNLANWNSSSQIVISGEKDAVEEAVKLINAPKSVMLPVSAPFHSELMLPAQEKLSVDIDNTTFSDLKFPIINNVDSEIVSDKEKVKEGLKRQVTGAVLWHKSMTNLLEEKKINNYLEIGTGRVLSGLIKRTSRELGIDVKIENIQNFDDLSKFI